MNALTGAGVYVEDKLFSTLDTRTRQWHLKDWGQVLLSDTVGFIRDLPHHLVASFKATLEEARQARLLLHVVDASNPHAEEQIQAVNAGAQGAGLRRQADAAGPEQGRPRRPTRRYLHVLQKHHPRAVAVSAATGQGLDDLRDAVIEMLSADFADAEVETSTPATARCWPTWPPTPRSTARSSTTTASRSAATCRSTWCTTSRGRT